MYKTHKVKGDLDRGRGNFVFSIERAACSSECLHHLCSMCNMCKMQKHYRYCKITLTEYRQIYVHVYLQLMG